MTFDEITEALKSETDALLEEYAPQIIENSDENPTDAEELPEELIAALLLLWNQAIDDIAESALEETNEQLDSSDDAATTEEDKTKYKEVGGYFFLEAMRRSFHRIHGTNIALQVEESERETEVQDAIEKGMDDVANSAFTELAFAFGAFIQREQLARGISSYKWQTVGDSRVRPTHRSNEGLIFSWQNPPATGHPGHEHNCRCSAIPLLLTNKTEQNTMAKSIEGLSVVAMGDDKVSLTIDGDIGDEYEGVNTTAWQVQHWNGITEHTKEIDVFINSRGGNLSHGVSIYTFLKQHPAKINTHITGEASSAASLIFLAGDNRYMPEGTFSGIHNPYTEACFCDLDFEGAQSIADQLKPHADSMVEIYAANMSVDEQTIRDMLSKNHVITSTEALELGFATAITPKPDEVSAKKTEIKAHLTALNNDFINSVKEGDEMPKDTTTPKGGDVVTVEEIQAKHDVLAHQNGELTVERDELKAQVKTLQDEAEGLRETVKAEVLEEQKLLAEVVAKSKAIEVDAEGETAVEVMRATIAAKGVKNPEAFEGDALEGIFEHVLAQYGNKQADEVYSSDEPEQTVKPDPFQEANKKV